MRQEMGVGWEEVVGGSARRRLPMTTTTQSVRSIQQGRGGFEVGLGAFGVRIYLGVQTAADRGNDGRRLAASGTRGSAVLGLVGSRRRGLEETLAAPPWGIVGGRWGLSRGGGCATLPCWIGVRRLRPSSAAEGVGSMKPWPRRRGGSSAAGAAYRVEADARRSLAGSGFGGFGPRQQPKAWAR